MRNLKTIILSLICLILAANAADAKAFPYAGDLNGGINGAGDNWDSYIDFVLPVAGNENSFFFIAPRASMTGKEIFGSEANEFNAGVGYRKYFSAIFEDGAIAGINVYYDNRTSQYGNNFQQAGAGIEFLSKRFDARVNGYFPFGDRRYYEGKLYDVPIQHHIAATYYYEVSMGGLDCEAGFKAPLPKIFGDLRVFGGYYYFTADSTDDIKGFKARAEYRPFNILRFTCALYENKDFNGSNWQIGTDISIPIDFRSVLRSKNPIENLKIRNVALKNRMGEMVMRDMYVRVKYDGIQHRDELLSNDRGEPYYFTVVSVNGSGDGTFENPASLNAGLLLNKSVTGDNANLLLLGGMYFQNTTLDLSDHHANDVSMIGNSEVEYWGGSLGKLNKGNPMITFDSGITGVAVNSPSNTGSILISGVEFIGTEKTGTGIEITNYVKDKILLFIGNNSFSGFDKGILVINSTDTAYIYNNVISANNTGVEIMGLSAHLEANIIYDNFTCGIYLNQSTEAFIKSNRIYGNDYGVKTYKSSSSYIYDNEIAENNSGAIKLAEDLYADIKNNFIFSNTADAVYITSGSYNTLTKNYIYKNNGNGVTVINSTAAVLINNVIYENTGDGVNISSAQDVNLQNNEISINALNGIRILYSANAIIMANQVFSNAVSGLFLVNAATATLLRNTFADNAESGILLSGGSGIYLNDNICGGNNSGISMLNVSGVSLISNTFNANFEGITIVNSSNVVLNQNLISENIYGGLGIDGGSNITVSTNSFVYNDGYGGIFADSSLWLIITGNYFTGNKGSGISVSNTSNTSLQYNDVDNNIDSSGIKLTNAAGVSLMQNVFTDFSLGNTNYSLYLLGTTTFNLISGGNKFLLNSGYGGDPEPITEYELNVRNKDTFTN